MCLDIEFMLHKKTCFYWRICWSIITPLLMFSVFVYSLITNQQPKFGGTYTYPDFAYRKYFLKFLNRYLRYC